LPVSTNKDAKQSRFVGLKKLTELYIFWVWLPLVFLQAPNALDVLSWNIKSPSFLRAGKRYEHREIKMIRILFLLTLLSTCGIAAAAQSLHIDGRQWKLVELNGSPVATSNAYLQFDGVQTRFSGNAGCNRMFGVVEIRGRQIAFSNIGTTRMACVAPLSQAAETAFLSRLRAVDRFRLTGNTLELMIQRRVVLRFEAPVKQKPEEPGEAVQLHDKKWMLESIGNTPVPKIGRNAFLVFDNAKASAGGNSRCNAFGGSYSATDGTLKITEIISTMRACIEDERMDVERGFLDGLRETNRFKIRDGKLMLYRNERLLLTLTGESK
jgi:heat shock protein HslJ